MAASGAGSQSGNTVFLEPQNRIVEDFVTKFLSEDAPTKNKHMVVGDFDDTTITLDISSDALNVATIDLHAPYVKEIRDAGAFGPAEKAFGAFLQPASDPATVSLSVNRDSVTGDAASVISTAARIKREVVGAPFQHLLEQLVGGTITQAKPFAVHLRSSEIVYFCPGADRVTVGFGLHFPDATDAAVVRIVCSQFAEVQRTIGTAPTVNFCELGTGATIPREISSSGLPLLAEGMGGFTGYLTLSYFPSHAETPEKMENTVTLVSSFRTYLNYHLKAAKSYIHSRMRNRVTSLLQVLERAKTSDPTVKKVKKTFQGKAIRKAA